MNENVLWGYSVSKNNKQYYTISGRTVNAVINDTLDILMGYYQVNKEVLEDKDKIKCLENIVDLIKISENI